MVSLSTFVNMNIIWFAYIILMRAPVSYMFTPSPPHFNNPRATPHISALKFFMERWSKRRWGVLTYYCEICLHLFYK